MTIQEFEALNEISKGEVVVSMARYLESRLEPGYKVSLYALDLFFIEVFYSDVFNEIFQLRSFASSQMLEPYLKNNLNDLL